MPPEPHDRAHLNMLSNVTHVRTRAGSKDHCLHHSNTGADQAYQITQNWQLERIMWATRD